MNRRRFLSMIGLAPVAVVAARSAAAPSPEYVRGVSVIGSTGSFVKPAPLKAINIRSCDLEFTAWRRYSVEEICRIYSIHLDDVGSAA